MPAKSVAELFRTTGDHPSLPDIMNILPAFSRRCAGLCLGLALAAAAQPALAGGKLAALNSLTSSSSTPVLLAPKQGVLKPSATVAGPLLAPAVTSLLPGAPAPQLKAPASLNGSFRSSSGAFIQNNGLPKLQSPAVPLPNGDVVLPISQDGQFVDVSVYSGLYQVTLEATSKGGWKPVDTTHLNGGAQTVRFNLPAGVPFAALRARGTPKNKFAAGQWFGASAFVWQDDSQGQLLGGNTTLNGSVALTGTAVASSSLSATSGVTLSASSLTTAATATATTATTTTTDTTTTTTAAVESDIWKVIGNRLFFFNQYRGMQVFDLTTPSQPVKIGALRMAAVGEQFYALDDTGSALALLARNDTRKQPDGSAIHLLTVSAAGKPTEVGQLPVSGYIIDSRLLGTRLYVLFYSWDTTSYTYKNSLVGYDLATPESPVSLGTVDLPAGWEQQLQAAGGRLMVSSTVDPWYWDSENNNCLSVLDVSGDGTPRLIKTVNTVGSIADQFKMNINGDTLTAVSQSYASDGYYYWYWNQSSLQTWVETFSLSADNTAPLAQLHIDQADGELLHATSFDGNRLYVVTCRNLDPLFIIDLTDPANPKITGELVTPGWAAYIQPNGNRLLTVGVEGAENWNVAISWFDVSDATSPKLLSRVYPGDGVHYTWSEAIYDYKAVNWDQAANKVFVPFQMWDWDAGGYTSATQVVSIANDTLTLDIAIKNEGTARRGTVVNGDLVSISGQQLVVTTNPDDGTPQQIAALELAWPVDRVAALDHYLLQIEDGTQYGWWGYLYTSTQEAVVRLSDSTDPDTVLDSVSLGLGNVIGMTQAGSLVYVAQLVPQDAQNPSPQLRTWALGIDASGKIQTQSAATVAVDPSLFWRFDTPNAQAVWPTATTLVWHVPLQPQYYLCCICCDPIAICATSTALISGSIGLSATTNTVAATNTVTPSPAPAPLTITYAPPVGELCAMEFPVDVSSATSLTAGSGIAVCIPPDGNVMSVGKAFADQGFVFFSAQRGNQWYYGWNYAWPLTADANYSWEGWLSPYNPGVTSSLHVLDFRNGLQPVVRDPVSLPGLLLSVSNVDANGAYLITDRNAGWYADGSNKHRITSLAYDSVRAHEVDKLDMQDWAAQDSAGGTVYFSLYPTGSNTQASVVGEGLNAWSGKFENRGTWPLDQAAYSLKVVGTYVLASSWGDLEVAQILPGNTLQPRASLDLPFYIWYDVDRPAIDATATGLWLPAGDYGVDHFDFTK